MNGCIEIRYDTDGTLCQPDDYNRYEGMSIDEATLLFEAIQAQQKQALKWAGVEDEAEEDIGPSVTIALCHFCRAVIAWDMICGADDIVNFIDEETKSELLEDAIAMAYMREPGQA